MRRHVHDEWHEDAIARARLAEQLRGHAGADRHVDVHELPELVLERVGRLLDHVHGELRRGHMGPHARVAELVPRRERRDGHAGVQPGVRGIVLRALVGLGFVPRQLRERDARAHARIHQPLQDAVRAAEPGA